MKETWNSDMDYGFSVIRTIMWILGVWPLEQNELVCTVRWFTIFIVESLTMLNLLIEPFKSCGDSKDALEVCLIIETGLHAWTNMIFGRVYMKKIASNVISAIDDWSSPSMTRESYLIMTGYARVGRIITMSQVMIGFVAASLYFIAIIIGNNQQVVSEILSVIVQ
ncbi:uncharacterized protein LOC112589627 [Harpegnathos saltator]|uniref:uncharacterized protein LOC112589627 n=1 Tax=Harpegnathos saltator TaxID=610380 RepID=UPI000DBEE689|nr:uncharacterized protein LOC112589627 [Harpegnathos saltator]